MGEMPGGSFRRRRDLGVWQRLRRALQSGKQGFEDGRPGGNGCGPAVETGPAGGPAGRDGGGAAVSGEGPGRGSPASVPAGSDAPATGLAAPRAPVAVPAPPVVMAAKTPVQARPAGAEARPGGSIDGSADGAVPRGLRIAAAWAWRLLLLVAAGITVIWLMARLKVVVIPLVIAMLLTALLSPLVGVLRRRARMPGSLATFLVVITGLAAVAGTLTLVITQFVEGAPELSAKAADGVDEIQNWLQSGPLHLSENQLQGMLRDIGEWFTKNQDTFTSGALGAATTIGHVLTGLFLVLFATFFLLRDGRKIGQFVIGMLPRRARPAISSAAEVAWSTLVSYVRATVLVAFIDAVGIGLAIVILDVPFPLPLAALVFLGSFVPIVGSTVSGAVAVLVALVDRGLAVALILLAAVIAVQQLEGHLLQPLIMGRAVAIHPLAVIVAIATGGVLAGIVGALVAVPIVAILNNAIRHLVGLRRAREAGAPAASAAIGPPGPDHAPAAVE